MKTMWREGGSERSVLAPVSLIVSAFSPVQDARATLTPELDLSQPSRLLLVDLGKGQNRLGGSCWAQVHLKSGGMPADLDSPQLLSALFSALREMKDQGLALAYHDRSDGGLLVTLLEMAFAAHCGLGIDLGPMDDVIAGSFAEELGAVIQVPAARAADAHAILARYGLAPLTRDIGEPTMGDEVQVHANGGLVYSGPRLACHARRSADSFRIHARPRNPECAREEYSRLEDAAHPRPHARPG